MGYSNIEKHSVLKKDRLDPNQYTLSLLREAESLGLMDKQTVNAIQQQFMVLLGELILKYTKGGSTSVKVETGQRIMLSLLYCIDNYTQSFAIPQDAINILTSSNILEVYKVGLEMVESCLRESEQNYKEIRDKKLDIPNEAYQSTIDEALPDVFENYDALFNAHDTMSTMAGIDYPLLFDDMKMQGIFYIRHYILTLELENNFCRLFALEDIKQLLSNYGRVYGLDYREALINVFEIIMTNSIFSILAGNKAGELWITPLQLAHLQEKFKDADTAQCLSIIAEAVEALIEKLSIQQLELQKYMRDFTLVLIPRFLCARENNTLANVVILEDENNVQAEIFFNEGDGLDNDCFCSLVEEIMEHSDPTEKAGIISSGIRTLGDFIDVLEADCLYGEEYRAVFDTLEDLELSVLARIVYIEELQADPSNFSLLNAVIQPGMRQWQFEYSQFVQTLSSERLTSIEKYMHFPLKAGHL